MVQFLSIRDKKNRIIMHFLSKMIAFRTRATNY